MTSPSELVAALLGYAARGWRIYPQNPRNRHGYFFGAKDGATSDPAMLRKWAAGYPDMEVALMTGAVSGVVALDIDIKHGVDGRDTLETFGVSLHPQSLTDHSPNGGYHILFRSPGRFIKSGRLGPGLEVKGDGGWITIPPGPGRSWDPIHGLETPLASMPDWCEIKAPAERQADAPRHRHVAPLSAYGRAALDGAVRAILEAGAGEQRSTMNRESFSVGGLVAAGEIPADLAIDELSWAADKVPSLDAHRPWRAGECRKIVERAFLDGQRSPRKVRRDA